MDREGHPVRSRTADVATVRDVQLERVRLPQLAAMRPDLGEMQQQVRLSRLFGRRKLL